MAPIRTGAVIDERYELEALIGEGGFGVVYRARQLSTGQAVALKFLLKDRLTSARAEQVERARFEREMQLIAQLKHPHIVRLLDSGAADGKHPYMVLEFVDGETLFSVSKREGALSHEEAAHLLFQVLDALAFAHELGIIHRDLKPHNVMLTRGGFRRNAMVLDFGVAGILKHARGQHYVSLTARDEVRGTPNYMAPEQLTQGPLTAQTDVYAWGLLFIEALTGKLAVDGETPFEVALRQADPDPIVVPPTIDEPELRRIITRAVAKPLDQRYASASEALVELQAWLGHAVSGQRPPAAAVDGTADTVLALPTVPAAAPSEAPAEAPAPRRRTALLAATLVALLAVAGLVAWSFVRSGDTTTLSATGESPPACTAHAQCDEGAMCAPSGQCVALAQAGCGVSEGALRAEPAPVLVGAIGPHDTPAYAPREQALRLAVKEINDAGGLPDGRRLFYLACDDYGQAERAVEAAQHLVALGAAAIIGPSSSGAFIDVVTRVTRPAGVLTVSYAATSPAISALADDGLALRTVPSDQAQGLAMVALVGALAAREVVVIARGDAYGAGLLDVVAGGLSSALGSGLSAVSFPARGADVPDLVTRAVRPEASLVIVIATGEAAEIVRLYEDALPADAARPRYLLSESGRRPEVLELARQRPELVGRIDVIGPSDRDRDLFPPFALRLAARFGAPATASKLACAYDAAYVVAMLLAAADADAPEGLRHEGALARLVEGEPMAVGPGHVGRAMQVLASGAGIDLQGASGDLEFDPRTGDVASPTLLWRVRHDLDGAPQFAPVGRRERGDDAPWLLSWHDASGTWDGHALRFAHIASDASPNEAFQATAARITRRQWTQRPIASPCPTPPPAPPPGDAAMSGVGAAEATAFCEALGLRLPRAEELGALRNRPVSDAIFDLHAGAEWVRCTASEAGCVERFAALGADGQALVLPPETPPACHRAAQIGFRCARDAARSEP